MIPWHFTPQPAHLPVEQFRDGIYHPDKPEKLEMTHSKLFRNDTQRLPVLRILIGAPLRRRWKPIKHKSRAARHPRTSF